MDSRTIIHHISLARVVVLWMTELSMTREELASARTWELVNNKANFVLSKGGLYIDEFHVGTRAPLIRWLD